jgi:hypothetical protein
VSKGGSKRGGQGEEKEQEERKEEQAEAVVPSLGAVKGLDRGTGKFTLLYQVSGKVMAFTLVVKDQYSNVRGIAIADQDEEEPKEEESKRVDDEEEGEDEEDDSEEEINEEEDDVWAQITDDKGTVITDGECHSPVDVYGSTKEAVAAGSGGVYTCTVLVPKAAGEYRVAVGVRPGEDYRGRKSGQESDQIAGSPWLLVVSAGPPAADMTIAMGNGIMGRVVAGTTSSFLVKLCDRHGNHTTTHALDDDAEDRGFSRHKEAAVAELSAAVKPLSPAISVKAMLHMYAKDPSEEVEVAILPPGEQNDSAADNGDAGGCYRLSYRMRVAGKAHASVKLGREHIRGSPFEIEVLPGPLSVLFSAVEGSGVKDATLVNATAKFEGVTELREARIVTRDAFGNQLLPLGSPLQREESKEQEDGSERQVKWRLRRLLPPGTAAETNGADVEADDDFDLYSGFDGAADVFKDVTIDGTDGVLVAGANGGECGVKQTLEADGVVVLAYRIGMTGVYELAVSVGGQELCSSPYRFEVTKDPVEAERKRKVQLEKEEIEERARLEEKEMQRREREAKAREEAVQRRLKEEEERRREAEAAAKAEEEEAERALFEMLDTSKKAREEEKRQAEEAEADEKKVLETQRQEEKQAAKRRQVMSALRGEEATRRRAEEALRRTLAASRAKERARKSQSRRCGGGFYVKYAEPKEGESPETHPAQGRSKK